MTNPTKDPLPSHLRQALTILQDLHDAVNKGSRESKLHSMLGEAESYILGDATLPPRPESAGTSQAYVHLRRILDEAYNQSAEGKGKERHEREEGQPFEDQPICQLQRMFGTGGGFYQVAKKMEESQRLPFKQAKAELLGGIVYLAASIKVLEEEDE